jgi:hypothetical protein
MKEIKLIIDGVEVFSKKSEEPPALPKIKIFSQRDPLWRHEKMGGTNQTIGGAGCALCCAAMVGSQVQDITPKWLNNQNPYHIVNGTEAHLMWSELPFFVQDTAWYPLHRKTWKRRLTDLELMFVINIIKTSPAILWVDFYPGGAFNTHFVLGLKYLEEEADILIADPWDGVETKLLRRYATPGQDLKDAIWGLRGYYAVMG